MERLPLYRISNPLQRIADAVVSKQQFLNTYYPAAFVATQGTGLFPETLITQLIGESGYQLSDLARLYFNFFGIKATPQWQGRAVSMNTKEFSGQQIRGTGKVYNSYQEAIRQGAPAASLFRVYPSLIDGFRGWVSFLTANTRYRDAGVFRAKNPVQQFVALKAGGYSTSPNYVQHLTNIYAGIKEPVKSVPVTKPATGLFASLLNLFKK